MIQYIIQRRWVIISTVLFLILVYILWFPPSEGRGKAVAEVNGVPIMREDLFDALLANGGDQTLQMMIEDELIRQEAAKKNIEVTEDDIQEGIAAIQDTFASEDEFAETLAAYGMTLEDLEKSVVMQAQLRKLLEPQVSVTDEEIRAYYEENAELFSTPEQVKASHILLETKDEAEAVLSELANGADFAEMAKEKSTDATTKESGGELGFVSRGMMVEAFETAAFALADGQVSGVVETEYGFHIIQVSERQEGHTPSLEEKKEEIRAVLTDEAMAGLSESWMAELKSNALIETYIGGEG